MTTSQNIRIYELLKAECSLQQARQLTKAIAAVLDEKVEEGNKKYEILLNKDLQIFRKDMDVRFAEVKGDINQIVIELKIELKDQKADMVKWLVSLFFALALMIFGLYFRK